jgi:hypothetical protein
MARFVTGSSDGLGLMVGQVLADNTSYRTNPVVVVGD